ncbi:hypothetical protein BJV74DRAFT_888088 [Russula compacta]|nr:hypothetical protein BJV74DRAFT_888088 [Russula compacta]
MPRTRSHAASSTCYIGIAFYTFDSFTTHWVIVLSESDVFEGDVLCGTIILGVNGCGESWVSCTRSPAMYSGYICMSFLGVVLVAKVSADMEEIKESITESYSSRRQRVSHSSHYDNDTCDEQPYPSQEYVRRALFHICEQESIRLPADARRHFVEYIEERRGRFWEKPRPGGDFTKYPVIPVEGGEVVFGHAEA